MTEIFSFKNLSNFPEIKNFVSTRIGGFSNFTKNDLNISFETKDTAKNVLKNRKILFDTLKINIDNCVMQNQVHGNKVIYVDENDITKGVYSHSTVVGDNDAMITDKENVCLFVFAADCVPILLYDSENKIIAAVHSGWQGTVKKIVQKTILLMQDKFGTKPANIIAGIGPSISVKNYEVGQNVIDAVIESFGTTEKYMKFNSVTKKYHFDLWFTNKLLLTELGVPEKNIEISGLCTFANSDKYFSARKDEPTGRFGAGIMLNDA